MDNVKVVSLNRTVGNVLERVGESIGSVLGLLLASAFVGATGFATSPFLYKLFMILRGQPVYRAGHVVVIGGSLFVIAWCCTLGILSRCREDEKNPFLLIMTSVLVLGLVAGGIYTIQALVE